MDLAPREVTRRARFRPLAVLAVAAAFGASACASDGGSDATRRDNQGSKSSSDGPGPVDVCGLVSAEDAAQVFGAPARVTDAAGTEAGATGICLYEGVDEPATVRNLLQMRVYDGDQYYGDEVFSDREPLAIGDRGFVNVNAAGRVVDVQFVQDGRTVAISYSAGRDVDVTTKVDALERIADQLAAGL